MKRNLKFCLPLLLLLCSPGIGFTQKEFSEEITSGASALYQSFSKTQQVSGLLQFSDTARLKWNNLPVGLRARAGTSIGNMTDEQRKLMHRVLSASLSSQGYLKATGIMNLDNLLNSYFDSLYNRKEINDTTLTMIRSLKWSHKNYFFAFFGKPGDKAWGYKLEGHHLSVNFTITGNTISVTPWFVGTDPAEYGMGEYAGLRVLGQEEDLALKLVNSLNEAQRKEAIKSTEVPRDIITGAESGKRLTDDWGLRASAMDEKQKSLLHQIIREYVFNMEYEKATIEYEKIVKAGFDKIYFGWIGETEEKKPHYFVVNGPTFLVEFDNNGGPRRAANHIHTIWREKGNEYGEDVLKKHYEAEKH